MSKLRPCKRQFWLHKCCTAAFRLCIYAQRKVLTSHYTYCTFPAFCAPCVMWLTELILPRVVFIAILAASLPYSFMAALTSPPPLSSGARYPSRLPRRTFRPASKAWNGNGDERGTLETKRMRKNPTRPPNPPNGIETAYRGLQPRSAAWSKCIIGWARVRAGVG